MESPEATEYTIETTQEISTNSNVSVAPQTNDAITPLIIALYSLSLFFLVFSFILKYLDKNKEE